MTGGGGVIRDDDDSAIFSPRSASGRKDCDTHELFCFHLNYDVTFDLDSREFYNDVSSTSTPSAVRSSDVHQRHDYDTDDSGFSDSLVSDSDLLQMSNLHLGGDDSHCDSTTGSRRSDTFPLPKLCLLSHFDEYDERPVTCTPPTSQTERKKSEVVPSERVSVRRQRSPEAVVERCSRHRLSLDSFSESRSEDRQPIRRRSDSFVPTPSAEAVSASVHSILPPPTPDNPLQVNLPPSALDDPLPADSLPQKPLPHISSPLNVLQKKPLHDNRVLEPSPIVDRVLDPSPVFEDQLQLILSQFAPPCLSQLIGRKIGVDYVDIISELWDRSMRIIIRQICDYLSDNDLCRCECCFPLALHISLQLFYNYY